MVIKRMCSVSLNLLLNSLLHFKVSTRPEAGPSLRQSYLQEGQAVDGCLDCFHRK